MQKFRSLVYLISKSNAHAKCPKFLKIVYHALTLRLAFAIKAFLRKSRQQVAVHRSDAALQDWQTTTLNQKARNAAAKSTSVHVLVSSLASSDFCKVSLVLYCRPKQQQPSTHHSESSKVCRNSFKRWLNFNASFNYQKDSASIFLFVLSIHLTIWFKLAGIPAKPFWVIHILILPI